MDLTTVAHFALGMSAKHRIIVITFETEYNPPTKCLHPSENGFLLHLVFSRVLLTRVVGKLTTYKGLSFSVIYRTILFFPFPGRLSEVLGEC